MGSWKTLSVLMLGQSNFVGTLIGHYLEDLGRKNCFISVSHLLTCLLYAILKLLQEGKGAPGQTPLHYRVTTIHPHLPQIYIYTHTHSHKHTQTNTPTNKHTHTKTYTDTHTQKHTHKHTIK